MFYFYCLFSLFCGAYLVYSATNFFLLMAKVNAMTDWVSTKAIVVDNRFVSKNFLDGNKVIRKGRLFFYYQYSVGDTLIGSSVINMNSHTTNIAKSIAKKTPVGEPLDIFYNPNDITESCVLSAASHSFLYDGFKFFISIALFSISLWVVYL